MPDGVEATAQDGNLTLTGTVSYGAAWMARGVCYIDDELEVTG